MLKCPRTGADVQYVFILLVTPRWTQNYYSFLNLHNSQPKTAHDCIINNSVKNDNHTYIPLAKNLPTELAPSMLLSYPFLGLGLGLDCKHKLRVFKRVRLDPIDCKSSKYFEPVPCIHTL